jgi:hypothetical protein
MSEEQQAGHPDRPPPAGGGAQGDRALLKTGTYLHTSCPHCGHDLVEANWIQLGITNEKGEQGRLRLSPRFNVFQRDSDVALVAGTEIHDLVCPRCSTSIVEDSRHCSRCDSRTARLHVSFLRLDLELFFCLRIGCPWHGLSEEDEGRVVLEEERRE